MSLIAQATALVMLVFSLISAPQQRHLKTQVIVSSICVPPVVVHIDGLPATTAVRNRFVVIDVLVKRVAFRAVPRPRRSIVCVWPSNASFQKHRFNVFSVLRIIQNVCWFNFESDTYFPEFFIPYLDAQFSQNAQKENHNSETANIAERCADYKKDLVHYVHPTFF